MIALRRYLWFPVAAPYASVSCQRALFVTRVYAHVLGALACFAVAEVALFRSGIAHALVRSGVFESWLAILGASLVASSLATWLAARTHSRASQYAGLALFVALESFVFVPLLAVATVRDPHSVTTAASATLAAFAALTAIVHGSRLDFDWLGALVKWALLCALAFVVAGAVFGFDLGVVFSMAMVVVAGGAMLYQTSRVLRDYPTSHYVAAALELLASVFLAFWYLLRIASRFAR